MSLANKIVFNTIIHTAGKFGASFVGILVVAILTRYLGVTGYGQYTTIFAYLFFFGVLSDLGLYAVTVNELGRSEYGEQSFFNNIFTIRFFSALIMMLAADALIWFFPYTLTVKVGVMAASLSIFLNLLDQITVAFFQNKINMKRVAIAELAGKIVLLITTILFVYLKLNLIWLIMAIILGFIFNFSINLNYLNKFIKLKFEFHRQIWQNVLRKSWPIAITSVFSLIYFKADTLFLSVLPANPEYASSAEQAVGIYGAPYKILEVLITFPAIFMGLVSPLLSRAWDKQDGFENIFQKAFNAISIIIWPLVIGVLVLAKPLMILLAGNDFAVSAPVFRILIWATAIIFITHLTTYAIIAIGKQKNMIKYYLSAAILAVAGYIMLIPRYSYFAAAWITVAVELFMLVSTLLILKHHTGLKIYTRPFGKAMLSAVIMGFVLNYLRDWNVIILIILGAIIYLAVLILTKTIDKDFLKNLVSKS